MCYSHFLMFFFFKYTASTEIYTLSLHDALPILPGGVSRDGRRRKVLLRGLPEVAFRQLSRGARKPDRKSTRLNSSHSQISYAVFCLKKKKSHRRSPSSASQSASDAN